MINIDQVVYLQAAILDRVAEIYEKQDKKSMPQALKQTANEVRNLPDTHRGIQVDKDFKI